MNLSIQETVRSPAWEWTIRHEPGRDTPGRATDFAAYSQRSRPSSGLEGPHDDQNDNGDNRDAGHFIGQAQRLYADPQLTPGEGTSAARQTAVIHAKPQHKERSEQRREGTDGVRTCRARGAQ